MSELPIPLVNAQWLHERLADPGLVVLDCSYHMPASGRDARAEFRDEHIPGARFFDFDGRIKDISSSLPHMLPDAQTFAAEVGLLGIGNRTDVVCYDVHGLFSAARGWWMFRVFGHDRVAVLDGGLPDWKRSGLPLAAGQSARAPQRFESNFRPALVTDQSAILQGLGQPGTAIIDARSADRFYGRAPEPRAGMRSGRIPGARSQAYADLLDASGRLLTGEALKRRLEEGVPGGAESIVASCGSGVTACILALAHFANGREDVSVYDGSWAEWGMNPELPIDSGDGK